MPEMWENSDLMQIVNVDINEIRPYENNPRDNKNAIPEVERSIREFGFKVPIVLTKDNVIVTGHTRYEAAKLIGMDKIPAIYADDLTEEQIKAFRLADNKVGEFSSWDFGKLEQELDGIDDEYFDELFGRIKVTDEKTPDDVDPEIDISAYDDEEFEYECSFCGFRFNA